jgi:hypothetical protein
MLRIGLEFLIKIHDVEKIEKLALIGVKPLDLGIIDRIRVDLDSIGILHEFGEGDLVVFLDLHEGV